MIFSIGQLAFAESAIANLKCIYKKMKEELEKGNTTLNITDDAMVVEEFTTNQVRFVQGDYKNIKVTTPEDIYIAELLIELDAKYK